MKATFHSTILEYRFVKQEDDQSTDYYDFWSYIDAITQGCKGCSYASSEGQDQEVLQLLPAAN